MDFGILAELLSAEDLRSYSYLKHTIGSKFAARLAG